MLSSVITFLLLIAVLLLFHDEANAWAPETSFRSGRKRRYHQVATALTAVVASANLSEELTARGLGLCYGVLYASGVRHVSDLLHLTEDQMDEMGIDNWDRRVIRQVQKSLKIPTTTTTTNDNQPNPTLSTSVYGAFYLPLWERFEVDPTPNHDFAFQTLAPGVFKGRIFTIEQCNQLSRMAEYHAYRGIGTVGAGWTCQYYTLTAQHMLCKDIPGMNAATRPRFQQLFKELYNLYPDRLVNNSICFDGEDEPHLVKYSGKAKGTALHRDNSNFVYVTVNVALSSQNDFEGGGTYIEALNKTISLEQGEMLIHLGDLLHSGVEITSGVRNLMIAFLACEWNDPNLNRPQCATSREVYDDDGW
jgi:hypothetical protein